MTDKPVPEPDALDLVIRARGGALNARERDALARALATSATLRVAYEVGSDLDGVARVRAGDETLIDRVLERALAKEPPIRRRRMPRFAAALAATLALASVAAAARQVLVWRSEPRPARIVERTTSDRDPGAKKAPSLTTRPTPLAEQAVATTTPPPTPATGEPGRSPDSSLAARARPETAASLFREAGAARRAGDLGRARALYAELTQRFPDSNEARVSRVSLGKLLLGAGNAREADAAFGQYLRSGAADLREEALVGRASALRALGRNAEERSVWEELAGRYPASVHASHARERIVEIERAAGARSR